MSDGPTVPAVVSEWQKRLPKKTRDTISMWYAVLVVLDRLKVKYDLNPRSHLTAGNRVSGQNPKKVKKILSLLDAGAAEAVDTEGYGGRTSAGSSQAAVEMLSLLNALTLDEPARAALLDQWESVVVGRIRELQNQERIKFAFDRAKPLLVALSALFKKYAKRQQVTALAQHLVGAKLELRFAEMGEAWVRQTINRDSVDSRDVRKSGDFVVNQHVFHVSVNPNEKHIEKCVRNLRANSRPVLLVPHSEIQAAMVFARRNPDAGDRIDIRSIESFVSQNIEELATYSSELLDERLNALIETYNARVREAEGKQHYEIEWETERDDDADDDDAGELFR